MLALESLVRFLRSVIAACILEAAIILQVEALSTFSIGSSSNVTLRKLVVHGNRRHVRTSEHALLLGVTAGIIRAFVTKPINIRTRAHSKCRDFDIMNIAVTGSR